MLQCRYQFGAMSLMILEAGAKKIQILLCIYYMHLIFLFQVLYNIPLMFLCSLEISSYLLYIYGAVSTVNSEYGISFFLKLLHIIILLEIAIVAYTSLYAILFHHLTTCPIQTKFR